ncbi:hypothetical protein [Singulisphaera acidiphila]|nr:hypothetical protein [Singulisphaera acidiphila]
MTSLLAAVLVMGLAVPAHAGLPSKVVQETAEFLMKKFGREAAEEGAERLAGKVASAVARHGDDVILAVRKAGPKALSLADEAGENAPQVLRFLSRHGDDGVRALSHPESLGLLSRYGDDAAEMLIRHRAAAAPVVARLGEPAVKALGAVGPQAGRRMAMLAGDLAESGQAPEVMGVIARYGDPAMDFLWRNKAILAGGATLAAFLADPEPYINGTADIARVGVEGANQLAATVAENAVKPTLEAAGKVASNAVEAARWPLTALLVAGIGGGVLIVRAGFFKSLPVRIAFKLAGKQAARTLFKKG